MTKSVSWLLGAMFLVSCGGNLPSLQVPGNPDNLDNVYEAVVALIHVENGNIRGPYCTATYVSPRMLATAAHCVPVNRIETSRGVTIVLPGGSHQSSIGQSVSFVEYHHYNEWVQRANEDHNHPEITQATVVGIDTENNHDVALLELKANEPDADHWLEMRNLETDPIQVGSHAYSIGMPIGQIWVLTEGIISRVQIRQNNTVDILHQVRIGPGSSGSALLDEEGRIIGINSAGWLSRGSGIVLGQAKPISYVQPMIRVLETQREIERLDMEFEGSRANNA